MAWTSQTRHHSDLYNIEVQLLDILMLINSDILMQTLVVLDSVRAFCYEIRLKPEAFLYSIWVHC